ncbi:MAG: hypothetical protein DDT40_00838 [candidate division WS2 bacterium]|nr:hypothetical protein [Candidatus Psychracetigena formicireducens]
MKKKEIREEIDALEKKIDLIDCYGGAEEEREELENLIRKKKEEGSRVLGGG